jgi:adhesin/invasin
VGIAPLAVFACDGGDLALPTENGAERLLLVEGNEQVGPPGERLPAPLIVRLVDGSGRGIPDRAVNWVVSAGGGRITPGGDSTDEDGLATAEWTLGDESGTNTVEAVVSRVGLVTFTATATDGDGPVLSIEPIEGDDQRAPVGSAVPVRPAVRVTDDRGEPVAGVKVSFEVTGGGGTAEGAVQTTNAEGIARVGSWVLGDEPGPNTLEAQGEALVGSPVVFTAEATAGGEIERLVYLVQPPDVDERERFRVEVALVDGGGDIVPLSGVVIYLGLFRNGNDSPSNGLLLGDRFRETVDGIAVFDDLGVTADGVYRLRALTDDLPELGPHGPEPPLFSDQFEVD